MDVRRKFSRVRGTSTFCLSFSGGWQCWQMDVHKTFYFSTPQKNPNESTRSIRIIFEIAFRWRRCARVCQIGGACFPSPVTAFAGLTCNPILLTLWTANKWASIYIYVCGAIISRDDRAAGGRGAVKELSAMETFKKQTNRDQSCVLLFSNNVHFKSNKKIYRKPF